MIIIKAVGGCWYSRRRMWSREFLQLSGDREESYPRTRRPRERSESGTPTRPSVWWLAESAVCINTSQRLDLLSVIVRSSAFCAGCGPPSIFSGYYPYVLSRAGILLTYSCMSHLHLTQRALFSTRRWCLTWGNHAMPSASIKTAPCWLQRGGKVRKRGGLYLEFSSSLEFGVLLVSWLEPDVFPPRQEYVWFTRVEYSNVSVHAKRGSDWSFMCVCWYIL